MNFLTKIAAILLLLLSVLVCTACDDNPYENITYTDTYAKYREPAAVRWLWEGNLAEAAVGDHLYRFAPSIPTSARALFIQKQETLLAYLEEHGIPADNLTTIILNDCSDRAVTEENAAYLHLSSVGTEAHIRTLLLTLLGDETTYGYIYALANHIAPALNAKNQQWLTEQAPHEIPFDVFAEKRTLLHLSLPCFLTEYVTYAEIDACKALSIAVLAEMEDPFAGERAFLAELPQFVDDYEPSELRFSYGGKSCPIIIETETMTLYRTVDYRPQTMESNTHDPIAKLDGLYDFFEDMDNAILAMRESIPASDTFPRPSVTLADDAMNWDMTGDRCEISTPTVYYLQYAYANMLFYHTAHDRYNIEDWQLSCYAHYYSRAEMFARRTSNAINGTSWSLARIAEVIGEPYDTPEDEIRFIEAMTVREYLQSLTSPTTDVYAVLDTKTPEQLRTFFFSGNRGALPFAAYIARRFGEDVLRGVLCNPSQTEALTGCTMDEISVDWVTWLLDTYTEDMMADIERYQ